MRRTKSLKRESSCTAPSSILKRFKFPRTQNLYKRAKSKLCCAWYCYVSDEKIPHFLRKNLVSVFC